MKIVNETRLLVIGHAEPTTSKDGNNTYYKVAVMQNGQATNLSVTREVYEDIPEGMVDVTLATSYDDKYQSFKVDRILAIHTVNGVKPDSKPDFKKAGNAPVGGK